MRGFFQCASRFAGSGIANDHAIRRIWRVLCDPRERERFRIRPVGVAVVAFEISGAIGKNFVEIFFVGQRGRAKHRVVPTAPEDPILAGMLRGVFAQALLDVGDVFRAFEIHAPQG